MDSIFFLSCFLCSFPNMFYHAYMTFSITKHEARKPDQRPIPNTYYYLDYKIFVDVVKYKIHKMGKKLDANMQQVQNEKEENDKDIDRIREEGIAILLTDVSFSLLDPVGRGREHGTQMPCLRPVLHHG